MSRIEELIKELCPDGVVYKSLGEILKNNNASDSVSKKDYKEVGKIPIIDQSQSYIAAYTDNESAVPPAFPCIIFGDHTRVLKYADKKFAQGDSGTKVFIPVSKNTNTKYIYYAFCNLNIPSRGYNRHWSIVKDIEIPLPPLPVQQEIVRILDNFTELTAELKAELTAELAARKKQYEYYRNHLLTFSDDVPMLVLGDVAQYSKGRISAAELNEDTYVGVDNLLQDKRGKTKSNYVPESGMCTKYREGDILIGNIRPYLKKIWRATNTGGTNGDVLVINITNRSIISEYLYQLLSSDTFFAYDMQHAKGAKMPRGSKDAVMQYKIPVPPLEEQERIVAILDRFDALCNDLTSGLPAEIAARRQQHEHYRDRLLTFKEVA